MAKLRKRQTRLTFTPVASSDDVSPEYDQIRDRAAFMGYDGSPSPAKRRRTNNDSPGRLVPVLPRSSQSGTVRTQPTLLSDDDEPPVVETLSRSVRNTTQNGARGREASNVGSSPTNFFNRSTSMTPARGTQATRSRKRRNPHEVPVISLDSESSSESSGDEAPVTLKSRPKRGGHQRTIDIPSDVEEDDDDDLPVLTATRRTPARSAAVENPDDEVIVTSRHIKRRKRPDDDEVDADARDLQGTSGSEEEATGPRSSQMIKRNARQEVLERLKRRRAGVVEEQETNAEDSDSADLDEQDDFGAPELGYPKARQAFVADQEDEGFVTDQDDNTQDGTSNLPLIFSRYAAMKSRDLFKYAVDWMVQKKINPAFRADDEIYTLTFNKLDDEVKQLAGSKFMSAAWTADFSWALRARPQLASSQIDRYDAEGNWMRDKCDACNRSGHPATWQVQFVGTPYHPQTLDPVSQRDGDSDEDGSSSSDDSDDGNNMTPGHKAASRPARDYGGRTIVPAETIFYVGKFCYRNCEQAHALGHWRYHLFEWVCEYLEAEGHLTPDKIVKRDKWRERKRRKYVNRLVDDMNSSGKIKELWREFRSQIDQARDAKLERW